MSFPEQTEKRLRLLSRIAEQMGEGIALFDLNGNVLFVNGAFADMHGYPPPELVNKNLSLFHSPTQMQEEVSRFNREAMSKGSTTGTLDDGEKTQRNSFPKPPPRY